MENVDETVGGMGTSQKVTGWNIKTLSEDDRKEYTAAGHSMVACRP